MAGTAITAVALAAATPALAALDAATLKLFGGTYCANGVSAKVTVSGDEIAFVDGATRFAGADVRAAASYYGDTSSPEYRTALFSENPEGAQLIAVIFQDDQGYYLTLDGDAKIMATIGKPLATTKYRRCDAASSIPAPVPRSSTAASKPSSSDGADAGAMLLDPKFRAAYYRALGDRVKQSWLARMDGPSPPTRRVTVGRHEYVLVSTCKDHDCADNNAVILYSSEFHVVYGKIVQRGRPSLIGVPPAGTARELERLWKKQWRPDR